MLTQTFIHAPGIGPLTERKLWSSGFESWETCLIAPDRLPLGAGARTALLQTIHASRDALASGDSSYFARALPSREHWRAWKAFPRTAFLDIETDGTDRVTVIGVYDGVRVRQYVRGDNLDLFPEEIEGFDLLVTFFGSGFDLPVLRRAFPGAPLDGLHCDLCHTLRRLGYRGGLKTIEQQLGIERSSSTKGLGGWDAVRLWGEYLAGSEGSLATLLAYNAEDIVNLEPLLEFSFEGLANLARSGAPGG
jgi:uncharacterized protein